MRGRRAGIDGIEAPGERVEPVRRAAEVDGVVGQPAEGVEGRRRVAHARRQEERGRVNDFEPARRIALQASRSRR